MCKAKPGRRCPKCRASALTAQQATVRRLHTTLQTLEQGTTAHTELLRERALAARDLIMRQADLDSTDEARAKHYTALDVDKSDIALAEIAQGKLIAQVDFDAIAKAEEAKSRWNMKHANVNSLYAD